MPVVELLPRHAATWGRATRHPFLVAVRDGTVPEAAFDAWLVQDHRFVSDLLWFQARLLARAPRPAQAVLAAGAGALVDELAWFERLAVERGLDLRAAALAATEAYAALLRRLDQAEVPVALATLWAVERAYLEAWSFAAPGAPGLSDVVAHWTTPEFSAYVAELARAADDALAAGRAPDLDEVVEGVLVARATSGTWRWVSARRPRDRREPRTLAVGGQR